MAAARAGDDREASYGPMTMPSQLDVVEDHIADAIARGGRAVVGGMQSIRRPYVDPTLLADVPEQSMAVRDETFGPTVTVTRVADMAEAVERANASRYALGSAVFAGNAKKAMAAARALRSGMTSINAVIAYATVPSLPFGGVGDSGFGRIHGADIIPLVEGVRMAREFAVASPMAKVCTEELAPGPGVHTDAEVREWIRRNLSTLYHPVGTCAMGGDSRLAVAKITSVVDPELRVRGVQGLRVVDASVMPAVPRGNTNAPTIAIAERAADLIIGRAPLEPADPALESQPLSAELA